MRFAVSLATFALGALALTGCSSGRDARGPAPAPSPRPSPAAISNATCPVMGRPVDPSVPTSVYQGRVIGFCCAGCKPTFDADPAAYAGNIR